MVDVSSLGTGRVRIMKGFETNVSVPDSCSPDKEEGVYEVTIVPGQTTAKELAAQLSLLGVRYVDVEEIQEIAGANQVLDAKELTVLDDYLEKTTMRSELGEVGVDAAYIMSVLTPAKVASKEYLEALKELHQAGVAITHRFIMYFPIEKALNKDYLNGLKELVSAGVGVSHLMISALDMEKVLDRNFLEGLKFLQKAGVEVGWKLAISLTSIRMQSQAYLECLIKAQGNARIADRDYIAALTGKDFTSVASISELISIYQSAYEDKTAAHILSEELSKKMLQFVFGMNDLHESSDEARLAVIAGFLAGELYSLVIFGHQEVFTSTFNLIFQETLKQMKEEGLDAYSLIERNDSKFLNYRQFLAVCAGFGRLTEFLDTIVDQDKKIKLLNKFVGELDVAEDKLQEAVSIAELMLYNKDPKIAALLEKSFLEAVGKAKDPETQKLYAMIGSLYYAEKHSPEFKRFAEAYPVKPVTFINRKDLVNKQNEVIEQMYFYGDKDGVASFNSFMGKYKEDESWHIEEHANYVVVTKQANGVKVKIYANRPGSEKGVEEIDDKLRAEGKEVSILVHRGHSYHAPDTIPRIPSSVKIVFMGSCGGFGWVLGILRRAPGAQIVATKGRGTANINEHLLKDINEELFLPQLKWDRVWKKAERQVGDKKNFPYYIRPDRNIAAQLIGLYTAQTQ